MKVSNGACACIRSSSANWRWGTWQIAAATLLSLGKLRAAPVATHDELMSLIEREGLFGRRIGYVDAHLLASTLLMPGTRLWTRDKRLKAAAEALGIAAEVSS